MEHKKNSHKQVKHIKKKYRRIAAGVAGAAIMAASMLPGVAAPVAQAATPASSENPVKVEQSISERPIDHHLFGAASAAVKAHSVKPSDNKAPEDFKQVLNIKATAYAPGAHDNDQWGNQTLLGTRVRPGIIAVDPSVIPLGSLVYVSYPDGHGNYLVAEDTGGAIKGNRIDVAKWTVNEAQDFGIQHVKVYVVKTPSELNEANV
jgi:3D (Asp-Asp-Asp) domain-containing protein